jgi:hypothetical protein
MMETNKEGEAICLALAEAVREASRVGRLIGGDELLIVLKARGSANAEEQDVPDIEALMARTLAVHQDLAALESISGQTLYHAPALLSRTYASILDRKGSPVILIAEEVRKNSADYPRPLPLEIFEGPPFDLTPGQIEDSLKTMAGSPQFQDITFTTTSTGAVYLFSSRYLERPYAAFLAERADVGLASNP